VDLANDLGSRDHEQVAVVLQVAGMVRKALAAIVSLLQLVPLDLAAHGAVEQQDALVEQVFETVTGLGQGGAPFGGYSERWRIR